MSDIYIMKRNAALCEFEMHLLVSKRRCPDLPLYPLFRSCFVKTDHVCRGNCPATHTSGFRGCPMRPVCIKATFLRYRSRHAGECVFDRIVLNTERFQDSSDRRLDLTFPFLFSQQRSSVLRYVIMGQLLAFHCNDALFDYAQYFR